MKNIQDSFDLFTEEDAQEEKRILSYLQVIHNEKVVDGYEYQKIFDTRKYDEFIGTSYSVGHNMIKNIIDNFNHVDFIVGICDHNYQSNLHAYLLKEQFKTKYIDASPISLFNDLNVNQKNKIINKQIQLNYPKPATPIHCKFYLLRNTETNDNRLIFGSANLSTQAFSNDVRQFEDIMIFDNHPFYEIFLSRYQNIKELCTDDFIPESLIEKYKSVNSKDIFIIDDQQKSDILTETFIKDRETLLLKQEEIKEIKEIPDIIYNEQHHLDKKNKKQNKIEERAIKTIALMLGNKNGRTVFKKKSKNIIQKNIKEITAPLDIRKVENKSNNYLDQLPILYRDDANIGPDNYENIFVVRKNDGQNTKHIPYNYFIEKEVIISSLERIDEMMMSYMEHLKRKDIEAVSRIYEAILYAFTSPFFSYLHKNIESFNIMYNIRDIPIFCIIGGAPGSGKTYLLKWIGKMTNPNQESSYLSYGSIKGMKKTGSEGDVSDVKKNINILFRQSNTYPLLIDEIEEKFFNDKHFEDLLVHSANELHKEMNGSPFPSFIGTTNSSTYQMHQRATSRIYYLKVDIPFDESKKFKSSKTYKSILNNSSDELFKDFLTRYLQMIQENPEELIKYQENNTLDFLNGTRKIFKSYYEMANKPLPEYFPTSITNDYLDNSKDTWRDLFRNYYDNKNYFSYNHGRDELTFFKNILEGQQLYKKRNVSKYYLDMLPAHIYKQSQGEYNYLIVIYAHEFFKWLGIPNPYKRVNRILKRKW
ncbi:AAA family ATPase [Macrococcoides canis]|uniref:AAA family ATPase n=1 Tax=Macrococcoides canis TaxID=1855823 RepID=UPI001F3A48AD|nr:AAA family ATPase [Macrococcus canis]UJS27444.1 AAA family ATPase [Macrococcus canis]